MIRSDVDLSSANTLGLPCRAERFLATDDIGSVRDALRQAVKQDWPLTVLGGGSNLVLHPWLPGLVLQPTFTNLRFEEAGQGEVLVHVGAGLNWHVLVEALAERDLWGIENLALIPGHCGAAPIQNIGAYGVEVAERIEAVHVVHRQTGERACLSREDCEFRYRDSVFKHEAGAEWIITEVDFVLDREAPVEANYPTLRARLSEAELTHDAVLAAVISIRRERLPDPVITPNVGSFF